MNNPLIPALVLGLSLACGLATPAAAQDPGRADEHLHKGDYLFKAGYYLKSSEHYRLALLEDPANPQKKLAFGHSLFAIGNYAYASYALRRGVAELDPGEPFRVNVQSLFPSARAFTQALRDLKRYVTYSPRDPAGLTVLGYMLYSLEGEERRCRDMFLYLKKLDRNDPFADYFLNQLDRRDPGSVGEVPPPADPVPPVDPGPIELPEVTPFPPAEAPPEPAPEPERSTGLKELIPPPARHGERTRVEWPEPVPAPAH